MAHLFSAVVSVGGSQLEELGRHCWSQAARRLVALPELLLPLPVVENDTRYSDALVELTKEQG